MMKYLGWVLILIFVAGVTFALVWFLKVVPMTERVAASEMQATAAEGRIKLMETDLQDARSRLEKSESDLKGYMNLVEEKEKEIQNLKEQIQKLEEELKLITPGRG